MSPRLLAPLLVACLPSVALAQQQQSSVFIGQVDPTASSPARRSTAPTSFDQILSNLNSGAGVPASAFSAPNLSAPSLNGSQLGSLPTTLPTGSAGPSQTNNLAVLNQFGGANAGTIDQTGQGNAAVATVIGQSNTTRQEQIGNGSSSTLNVIGGSNNVGTVQTGNNNATTLNVGGFNNNVANTQSGDGLSFGLTVLGRGANISITQSPAGLQTQGAAGPNASALPLATRR